jgi:hypothetical protein
VFYARITTIDEECINNMQKVLGDYIWVSNAPQSAGAAKGRSVQRPVNGTAAYAPIEDGIRRLQNTIAANQAWTIRQWLVFKARSGQVLVPALGLGNALATQAWL